MKRLRVKAATHTGQRRVFFVLNRATRKFPGDLGLWMQQIEYARLQKAYKKLSQILTKALRLHPSKPDLWIYAAHIAMDEHADMTEARSYMQRGLRFCKGSKPLWLEYMKLELVYSEKLAARQQILGIGESLGISKPWRSFDQPSSKMTKPACLIADASQPAVSSTDDVNDFQLQNLIKTPALSGAIPIAIFDAAMLQFQDDENLAQKFFDAAQDMDSMPCVRSILQHILDYMLRSRPSDWRTVLCNVKISCMGIAVTSPEFPNAFRQSLKRLQGAPPELKGCQDWVDAMRSWLENFIGKDTLDVALQKIMSATLRQLQIAADNSHAGTGNGAGVSIQATQK